MMHSVTKMAAVNYFPSIHDNDVVENKDVWRRFALRPKQFSSPAAAAAAAAAALVKAGADGVDRTTGSEDAQQLQASSPAASTTTTTTTTTTTAAWGCLVLPEYRPLDAFSATAAEDPGSASQSEDDEMCELLIRMKEMELRGMMGETPVISPHTFLRDIKWYRMNQRRRKRK